MPIKSVIVNLGIDVKLYESYYSGYVKEVVATSIDGRIIRFPANILQPFVTHLGVHGVFELQYGDDGKLIKIAQLNLNIE